MFFRKKKDEQPHRWVLSTEEIESIANDVKLKVLRALVECELLDPETATEWFMQHTCILKKPNQLNPGFFEKYKDSGLCPEDPDAHTFFVVRVAGLPDPNAPPEEKSRDHLSVVPFLKDNKEPEGPKDV